MFFRSILTVTLSAVVLVYATAITREVKIPSGSDVKQWCTQWETSCASTVGVSGTPATRCGPGDNGADTARVYCMSVYGDDAGETTDLTEDNAQAMGVQFA
ncbi:uncharacterized protein STEHIDRAFT_144861 [Stereum hirsutum FP-91666 SS1]|uniref:uncharacterized protein n=1 Tax=Stereum hirsutum (strain FP-91666) TaxID=721885 RepID=UPI000440F998|nr:uncharacterized protein STEHIDRAFT_144861 [Stereum hirsutum FP-91666 SS1]EIM89481.1 hypothetical protein STEHIDRAFT_144861 [Stereum hirsutum FP-91666 SS1]